ncbi:Putative oxidoreductase [Kitasatospora sp. MMS16-BH015]|uniref:ferredoxin reductase family protein n=1 Tax=Kitasatospora sp. MMS16-BH015 TaxID=2018025 RepID=UPI000CA322DF|nr:ferric reductase-like transmembrane domain-containing protein [Kitasatospora sp. MMS16-BH015]AUG76879.1 Putative oxidoreductase [Kitasatospora sp. MMS16-BH015]
MPVLIVIAIYAIRIARAPLDARLKKRHIGPLSVTTGAVMLYLAWDRLRPEHLSAVYFAGEFAGVLSAYLMSCTLVLATRLMWLEQWFGGLDRMYRRHKRYAVWSILLLTPHLLLHFFSGFDGSPYGYAHPTASVGMGHLLGAGSAIGLLLLVLISLGQVGRILRLPYQRWLFLHRLTGLLLLSALLHGWYLDLVINGSTPLLAIYVTMATIGMTAYAYEELVLRHREPRADYTVHRVERPTPDVLDLTLTPTGETTLPVTGGQFVYLRVGGWHEHPFSVAGARADGSVRLTIRALGRGTRGLYRELSEGHPATLKGPYGMFDHTLGGPRQIWIAGGIGIAPFLGWLTHSGAVPAQTDLFYCAPTAEEAPFLPELAAAAAHRPELRLHPTFSRSHGRLTAERIQAVAGPITPDTHVFLCGPASMVEDLSRALHRQGVPRQHLHAEHFAFR